MADYDDGSKQHIIMGILLSDATIDENWDVVALQGTGSCDFSLDNYFLSEDLTHSMNRIEPQPERDSPLYKLP